MKIFYILLTSSIFVCIQSVITNYEVYYISGKRGNMNVTIRMWKEKSDEEETQVLALSGLLKFDEIGEPPGRYRVAMEQEHINNTYINNRKFLRNLERYMRQEFLDEVMELAEAKKAILTDHNYEDASNLRKVYHLYDSP